MCVTAMSDRIEEIEDWSCVRRFSHKSYDPIIVRFSVTIAQRRCNHPSSATKPTDVHDCTSRFDPRVGSKILEKDRIIIAFVLKQSMFRFVIHYAHFSCMTRLQDFTFYYRFDKLHFENSTFGFITS